MELERFQGILKYVRVSHVKQFHGFTGDFTWRYTQEQVYQVYWGFPGNLLDFKEF